MGFISSLSDDFAILRSGDNTYWIESISDYAKYSGPEDGTVVEVPYQDFFIAMILAKECASTFSLTYPDMTPEFPEVGQYVSALYVNDTDMKTVSLTNMMRGLGGIRPLEALRQVPHWVCRFDQEIKIALDRHEMTLAQLGGAVVQYWEPKGSLG